MQLTTLLKTILIAVAIGTGVAQTSVQAQEGSWEYWGNGTYWERYDDGSYSGDYRGW